MKLYKKNIFFWLKIIPSLVLILSLTISGCDDDDDNEPEPPIITSLNPDSGLAGSNVAITGLNFGTSTSSTTVTFGTTTANITSINATLINVVVPESLSAGSFTVTVTTDGRMSNEVNFEVTELPVPGITSVAPEEGLPGTSITIVGVNFSNENNENTVTIAGESATITSASPTEIIAVVPDSLAAGETQVSVTVEGRTSNLATFTVLAPEISSISPGVGPIGTIVTITGTNFSGDPGGNTVTFADIEARIESASTTQIEAVVPAGIPASGLQVRVVVNGTASNAFQFTVLGPTVTGISPAAGPAGSQVIITGTNFGPTMAENSVTFGTTEATVTGASPNELEVTVPLSLAPGSVDVTVTARGVVATGSITYEVIVPVRTLYWIEQREERSPYLIIRGEIDENGTQQFETIQEISNFVTALEVDTETQEAYWAEESGDVFNGTIHNSSGTIYATGDFSFVSIVSIAIDTQRDIMYWIESDNSAATVGSIWRGDWDGNNLQNIDQLYENENYQILTSLTLDVSTNTLYFIEDFDDELNEVNSRIYQADLADTSAAPSIIYTEIDNKPTDSNVSGFLGLAVSGSSIYVAGTQLPGETSQILVGDISGSSTTLSVVYESNPGTSDNPMPRILNLMIDEEFDYIYWLNFGDSDISMNSNEGSIYRGPLDRSLTPELLYNELDIPNLSNLYTNPIKGGRSKNKPRSVNVGFSF